MKSVVLMVIFVLMVSGVMAVEEGEYECRYDEVKVEDISNADTFLFYLPKVGDVIDDGDIEYVVLHNLTLMVTKVNPSAIAADGILNIPKKVSGGKDVVRKTLVAFKREMPVTAMGDKVMKSRMDIKEVRMPSVEIVESQAFVYCNALISVEMPVAETLGTDAFAYCEALVNVQMPVVKTIENWGFRYCKALVNVSMPSVETLGEYAFSFCDALTSVEMPVVKTVGSATFSYCKALTSVQMPAICCFQGDSFSECPWQPTVAPVCP